MRDAALPMVGQFLQRFAQRELTDDELELHIAHCGQLFQHAYERFQAYGDPAERDAALLWLHHQNEAMLARSPAVQAARHAEFERRLVDEGLDYFQSDAALALGLGRGRPA